MTPDQFRALCLGAGRALALSDAQALFNATDAYVDNVKIGVFHDETRDPEGVFCYADLGPIGPDASAVALMEEILAINLSLDGERGEVIGMERESRHLVLRVRLKEGQEPLHEGRLADELRRCAAQANALYENALSGVQRPEPARQADG